MAGRKGTPTEIHLTQGTYRNDRHGSNAVIYVSAPDRPATLSNGAIAAWDHFAPILSARKVLTAGDSASLEVLCETYAEWRSLADEVAEEGRTYECVTESGQTMKRPNPKVAMLSDSRRYLNTMLAEFGLSPASRGKAQGTGEAAPVNKFAKLGG